MAATPEQRACLQNIIHPAVRAYQRRLDDLGHSAVLHDDDPETVGLSLTLHPKPGDSFYAGSIHFSAGWHQQIDVRLPSLPPEPVPLAEVTEEYVNATLKRVIDRIFEEYKLQPPETNG